MDTTETFEGTLSLYRCYGCTFQVVRKPGELTGHYRLTAQRFPLANTRHTVAAAA